MFESETETKNFENVKTETETTKIVETET